MENKKPLKKLISKLGYVGMASELGVTPTTVYRWEYRESGRPNGISPDKDMILAINELSKRHRISGLTLDYLIRL